MIEVVERRKDGYESDVSDEGFEDESSRPLNESTKLLDLALRYVSQITFH